RDDRPGAAARCATRPARRLQGAEGGDRRGRAAQDVDRQDPEERGPGHPRGALPELTGGCRLLLRPVLQPPPGLLALARALVVRGRLPGLVQVGLGEQAAAEQELGQLTLVPGFAPDEPLQLLLVVG